MNLPCNCASDCKVFELQLRYPETRKERKMKNKCKIFYIVKNIFIIIRMTLYCYFDGHFFFFFANILNSFKKFVDLRIDLLNIFSFKNSFSKPQNHT